MSKVEQKAFGIFNTTIRLLLNYDARGILTIQSNANISANVWLYCSQTFIIK